MGTRVTELRCKEVINITDGQRLGFVSDVEVQLPEGKVLALVVPDMIGVSVQPVYLPDGGIFQPMEIGAHRIPPVGRRISAAGNLLGLLYHEAAHAAK